MSSGSGSGDGRTTPPGSLAALVGLNAERQRETRAFFELGPGDADALRAMRPLAEASVDGIVEAFYQHLLAFPHTRQLLEAEPDRIERLKAMQRKHFLSITDGTFDEQYIESRLKVGNAHQRIGLEPSWYIGAFGLYLRLALRRLVDATGDGARILPTVEALFKSITLDMALAMQTYIYGGFVGRDVVEQLEEAAAIARDAFAARADTERMKDELAAMVVHDLKNPVNGISMMWKSR